MKISRHIYTTLFAFVLSFGFANAQTFNETSGTNSGTSITTGDNNALYGDSSGASLTTGSGNVLIGMAAGRRLTNTGPSLLPHQVNLQFPPFSQANVHIGMGAGYFSTTATDNVFIGSLSGYSNTLGNDNTIIGTASGVNNTTGSDNVFLGFRSGVFNTTGRYNTFLGSEAGRSNVNGNSNTMVGRNTGFSNTSGFQNAFLGRDAGYDNTTGYYNTCIGDSAGIDNSTGINNTMVGHGSGAATEYTSNNTFVGHYAGYDNNRVNNNNGFNAHNNSYLGSYAGYTNRGGNGNLLMGAFADFQVSATIGGNAISTQNNFNTGMGYRAKIGSGKNRMTIVGAWSEASADHAIAIGDSAFNSGLRSIAIGSKAKATGSNSIVIGSNSTVTADNQVYFGNSATVSIGGVVNWTATSDQRFKTGVAEDVIGLEFIKMLRPVTYNMDPNAIENHFGRELPKELQAAADEKAKIRYTGFLAQEVEMAAQASGYDFSGIDTPKEGHDAYGIRYAEFVVPLVKAIQEQQMIIEGQNQEIQAYQSALENLTNRVNQMEVQLIEVAPIQQVSLAK